VGAFAASVAAPQCSFRSSAPSVVLVQCLWLLQLAATGVERLRAVVEQRSSVVLVQWLQLTVKGVECLCAVVDRGQHEPASAGALVAWLGMACHGLAVSVSCNAGSSLEQACNSHCSLGSCAVLSTVVSRRLENRPFLWGCVAHCCKLLACSCAP
jgi:hypothetical protein